MTICVLARKIRTVYFTNVGQKVEEWLPRGEYIVGGEVWLDTVNNIRAITLHGAHNRTFYIGTNVL